MLFFFVFLFTIVHVLHAQEIAGWVPNTMLRPAKTEHEGHYLAEFTIRGRRNHECLVDNSSAVMFGGRWQETVEDKNVITGESKVFGPFKSLELSHVAYVNIDKRYIDKSYDTEVWLTCGFHGNIKDREESTKHVLILQKMNGEWLTPKIGPTLPRPTGACASLPLPLSGPSNPPHICNFGGSDGTHKKGVYLSSVWCFNPTKKIWHALPQMPAPMDHHSATLLPAGTCRPHDPARVLMTNFRSEPYAPAVKKVYALDLHTERDGKITFPGSKKLNTWYEFSSDPEPRDGSGVVLSKDNRYLVSFGGKENSSHIDMDEPMRRIRVFDICNRNWHVSKLKLQTPRFAVVACRHSERPMLCGGTHIRANKKLIKAGIFNKLDENANLDDCEVFDMKKVIDAALSQPIQQMP